MYQFFVSVLVAALFVFNTGTSYAQACSQISPDPNFDILQFGPGSNGLSTWLAFKPKTATNWCVVSGLYGNCDTTVVGGADSCQARIFMYWLRSQPLGGAAQSEILSIDSTVMIVNQSFFPADWSSAAFVNIRIKYNPDISPAAACLLYYPTGGTANKSIPIGVIDLSDPEILTPFGPDEEFRRLQTTANALLNMQLKR